MAGAAALMLALAPAAGAQTTTGQSDQSSMSASANAPAPANVNADDPMSQPPGWAGTGPSPVQGQDTSDPAVWSTQEFDVSSEGTLDDPAPAAAPFIQDGVNPVR